MAKKKKTKRKSMGSGTRKANQAAKTGVAYINLPKGFKLFKEEEDKRYNLDVMPYKIKKPEKHPDSQFIESDIWWRLPYKLHRNIGPDKKDFVCPKTVGRKCKVCDKQLEIYKDPHGDEELAKNLRAKDRVLYIVVPKKSKDYENKPHIWDISYFCFGKCLDKELDYEEDCAGFADLENGYTLKTRFAKEQIGKGSFAKCDRIDFKPRPDLDEDVLEELPDLLDCLILLSQKEIAAIYETIIEEEDDDDEDDEDEEDDEETDDDEDEDDDDDEDEDDEDEDEDDDDEDEDDDDEDEDDDDDELEADDVEVMNKKELNALVKSEKLKIKATVKKKLKTYRKAVIKALDLD